MLYTSPTPKLNHHLDVLRNKPIHRGDDMTTKEYILSFVDAINTTRKIQLTFTTKDNRILERTSAPLDIAPGRKAKIKFYKFHFWDYDSTTPHILSIFPDQIIEMKLLDETFSPEDIVTWDTTKSPWNVKRNWGRNS